MTTTVLELQNITKRFGDLSQGKSLLTTLEFTNSNRQRVTQPSTPSFTHKTSEQFRLLRDQVQQLYDNAVTAYFTGQMIVAPLGVENRSSFIIPITQVMYQRVDTSKPYI